MVDELKVQFEVAELPEVIVKLVGVQEVARPVEGDTEVESVREPVNPLRLVSVTVDVPDEPAGKVTVDGLAVMLKSTSLTTLTLTETEWDSEPLVPVTVTV